MCDNEISGLLCKDEPCISSFDCYSISCVESVCQDVEVMDAGGMSTGMTWLVGVCAAIPAIGLFFTTLFWILGKLCP